MKNRYKIIISNENLYKEVEVTQNTEKIKIGTDIECDARLHKKMFAEPIELVFTRTKDTWSVFCSENLYFIAGDVRKLMTKTLFHGDRFTVKYHKSNEDVFTVDFLLDFDAEERKFERCIDISGIREINIGTDDSNMIVLKSEYTNNEYIQLMVENEGLLLTKIESTYGVYHNGKKESNNEKIYEGDFLAVSDIVFYYKNSCLWTEIKENCIVNSLPYLDIPQKNNYPKFTRNARIQFELNETGIDILEPPSKPQKPKNNLFMRLLPSMGMLLAAVVMAYMGGAMVILSIISGTMAIVTTIIGVIQNNREFKGNSAKRIEQYNKYILEKRKKIEEYRKRELDMLNSIYLSPVKEVKMLEEFSCDLFDRTQDENDFLHVYLGKGSIEAKKKINYKKPERLEVDDELQLLPEQIFNEYKMIDNAPIICDLKKCNAIGIYGNEEDRFFMLKNLVLDICTRQFQGDIHLIFVASESNEDKVAWLRMLPHVYNEITGARDIVCNEDSKTLVFEYLYKELTYRKQAGKFDKRIIVFFYDEYGFKNHPISKFLSDAKELGITFIFLEDRKNEIPQGCNYLIQLDGGEKAELINTQKGEECKEFVFEKISNEIIFHMIDLLAPVYTEEISLEGTLTKNISLFELLNIFAVDDLNLETRWSTSMVYKSMAAPIGISKTGIVYLDLHDKAHGPHGLVAGTTGAGKSEILQTYILSIATLFHPYEIAFLIIDFKGGGMVNQFKELPHLLGAITNIDGKEIERSLKSIKAELQKRQHLFAKAEVNHIDKYIKKYKAGEVKEPLPHLIIVVDEFAELKAEQPEFMKELISAARIGRSLGVHLILATQKPSGQVNEQIWSNSRFKLCLKVQSQEDSNEVIKSPLAAEIKEPGRAYLQVGNNEIFELFQSAYSGASEKTDESNVKEFSIFSLNTSGKKKLVYEQKKPKSDTGNLTQLDAIVEYVAKYCEDKSIKRLSNICLPPLKDKIYIGIPETSYDMTSIPIGIYDDPDTQYQGEAKINVSEENTIVIGSAQNGKTNLLQLIIRMISSRYTPREAVFYVMDFGAMYLKNFEKLKHVGGVVTASEEERIKNLFKLLMEELQYRKEKFMQIGLSSFTAYKEAGYNDLPQIILLVDNFTIFKEMYGEKYEENFVYLLREGIAYGISMVITNSQTSGIGFKYMSNFASRLAFVCNDFNEYGVLFDRCRVGIKDVPGRMLFKINKELYELQSYVAFEGEKEIDRSNAIKAFVAEINEKNIGLEAKQIPSIPDKLTIDYLEKNYLLKNGKYIYHIALDYSTVDVITLDFRTFNEFSIIGKDSSRKVYVIKSILTAIKAKILDDDVRLYIIDSIERPLKQYSAQEYVEKYTIDYSEIGTVLDKISSELENRYEVLMEKGMEEIKDDPLNIVLVNNREVIEYMSATKEVMEQYNKMLKQYKALGIVFIFADIEDATVPYAAPELLKKIKESRKGIITSNLKDFKFCDIPSNIIRNSKRLGKGDVYLMDGSEIIRMKLIEEE